MENEVKTKCMYLPKEESENCHVVKHNKNIFLRTTRVSFSLVRWLLGKTFLPLLFLHSLLESHQKVARGHISHLLHWCCRYSDWHQKDSKRFRPFMPGSEASHFCVFSKATLNNSWEFSARHAVPQKLTRLTFFGHGNHKRFALSKCRKQWFHHQLFREIHWQYVQLLHGSLFRFAISQFGHRFCKVVSEVFNVAVIFSCPIPWLSFSSFLGAMTAPVYNRHECFFNIRTHKTGIKQTQKDLLRTRKNQRTKVNRACHDVFQ